jgi:hypothetical protein
VVAEGVEEHLCAGGVAENAALRAAMGRWHACAASDAFVRHPVNVNNIFFWAESALPHGLFKPSGRNKPSYIAQHTYICQ